MVLCRLKSVTLGNSPCTTIIQSQLFGIVVPNRCELSSISLDDQLIARLMREEAMHALVSSTNHVVLQLSRVRLVNTRRRSDWVL